MPIYNSTFYIQYQLHNKPLNRSTYIICKYLTINLLYFKFLKKYFYMKYIFYMCVQCIYIKCTHMQCNKAPVFICVYNVLLTI